MVTWTSVVLMGVMRSGNINLEMMSVEFAEESDVACERRKWNKTEDFVQNNRKDGTALSCEGETEGQVLWQVGEIGVQFGAW